MQLRSGNEFLVGNELRENIASYAGKLCTPSEVRAMSAKSRIISVGDVTTEVLHKNGIQPFLEVVDLRTKRNIRGEFQSQAGSEHVRNPPGAITHDMFLLIKRMLSGNGGRIEVDGEEDLAVIPIIFYSDINTVVTYGVPDVGMACIKVDEAIKDEVKTLIERMEIRCQN
ncbi:MAG: DUF359 domain-containing protein [Candidatus Thermoplasmatota archaeon]|jgi:hypothetical protein|nr:DUF359 domain-containing protein [Candidatus Thermoplasmatota archaeon]MCL5882209.1 DUF359 domain-containing protein [Candidatus Thermoplasmatota archaeon]